MDLARIIALFITDLNLLDSNVYQKKNLSHRLKILSSSVKQSAIPAPRAFGTRVCNLHFAFVIQGGIFHYLHFLNFHWIPSINNYFYSL